MVSQLGLLTLVVGLSRLGIETSIAWPHQLGDHTVTKKEIVKLISDKLQLPQIKTKEIVQLTFDAIVDTLVSDGRIELRNFGVFEVKRRKPRKARNPRTGDAVDVEAKNVVTFQPGKVMEEKVREAKKVVEPKRKARKPSTRPQPHPVPVGADNSSAVPSNNGELPLKPR